MQKAAICSSGTSAARVPEHERGDLVGVELVAVPLALDELSGSEHRQGSRTGWPATRRAGRLAAEPAVRRRTDVAELALVDPPGGVAALDVGQEQRVLAGMIGRRRRRIAAVVRGEHEEVSGTQRRKQVGKPPVEVLQAAMEVLRVVSVAPQHVGLHEVREDEPGLDLPEKLLGLRDPFEVRLRQVRLVDVEAGEDVRDLADAVDPRPASRMRLR